MLDMTLVCPVGREAEAARELFARLKLADWQQLVALAASVVSLQEQVATGQVYLVAPFRPDHLQAAVRECMGAAVIPDLRRR